MTIIFSIKNTKFWIFELRKFTYNTSNSMWSFLQNWRQPRTRPWKITTFMSIYNYFYRMSSNFQELQIYYKITISLSSKQVMGIRIWRDKLSTIAFQLIFVMSLAATSQKVAHHMTTPLKSPAMIAFWDHRNHCKLHYSTSYIQCRTIPFTMECNG